MQDIEFARLIKNGVPHGIFFFFGDEDYLSSFRAGEVKNAIISACPDFAAFNIFDFSFGSGEIDIPAIRDALSSPPMMSECKLITIFHAALDSLKAEEKESLLTLLEKHKGDDGTTVILRASSGGFNSGTDKKPSAFLKSISKFASVVKFDYQSEAKLVSWLTRHAGRYSLGISPQTAMLIVRRGGRSMWSLSGEIAKLSAYVASCGRHEITDADVMQIISPSDEDDAYALANAITAGNAEMAFACLGVKMRLKVDPYYLLGQISRTFFDFSMAAAFIADGRSLSEFTSETKLHEYRAKLLYTAAKKTDREYFIKATELCLNADRNMKTMSVRDYSQIESLIGLALSIQRKLPVKKSDTGDSQ